MVTRFLLSLLISLIFALMCAPRSAFGQSCDSEFQLFEAGYLLSATKIKILSGDQRTALTRDLSPAEIVDHISKRILTVSNLDGAQAVRLAVLIADAAESFKIDPFIFAALVQKESTFQIGAVSGTGSTGLTQLTSIGLKELRQQFGYEKGKYSPGVPEVLDGFAEAYLNTRIDEWHAWIGNTKPNKSVLTADLQFSLAAGAGLLKVYLAVSNGNYNKALQKYNGDKGKAKYARTIESWSKRIELRCNSEMQETLALLQSACDLQAQNPWACQAAFGAGQDL